MMELRRITLIQWFLFEAEQVDVGGDIAILGANGAGKSSILDALQTVLTGGMRRHFRFNASAQQETRSKRSIRSYCLGVIASGEEEGSRARTVRDQALTWLALGFAERTADGSPGAEITIAVCFHASQDLPEERFEGGLIVHGARLGTADFLEGTGDETVVRPVDQLMRELRQRDGVAAVSYATPERYVGEMLKALSPPHFPIDRQRFLRTFRKTISFKPSESTTEFVRNFVLEESPIEIAELRRSIAVYQDIRTRLEELQKKQARLKTLDQLAQTVLEARRTAAAARFELAWQQWAWSLRCGREAKSQQRFTEKELVLKQELLARRETDLEALDVQIAKIKLELAQSEPELRARTLEAEKTAAQAEQRTLTRELEGWRSAVIDAARIPLDDSLAPDLRKPLAQWLTRCATVGGAFTAPDWPHDPAALDQLAADTAALAEAAEQLDRQRQTLQGQAAEAEKALGAARASLERVSAGKRPLDHTVLSLQNLLADHGINAVPLCDLVEQVEPEWQPAIEASLGGNVQALVVPPEQAEFALALYRRSADGLAGARIVNTRKTDETRPGQRGSAAEVVQTGDRHARAFLDYHLGRIMLVDSERELLRHDSALTRDRMIARGRTTQRLAHPRFLLFGRGSLEETRRRLEAEIASHGERLSLLGRQGKALKATEEAIARTLDSFRRVASARACAELRQAMAEAAQRVQQAEQEIARAHQDQDPALRMELEELKHRRDQAKRALNDVRHELDGLNRRLGEQLRTLTNLEAERRRLARGVAETGSALREASQQAASAMRETLGRCRQEPVRDSHHLSQLSQDLGRVAEERERAAVTGERRFDADLTGYRADFQQVFPFEVAAPLADKAAWLAQALSHLDRFDLPEFEAKAAAAHQTFLQAFKNDFVSRMTGEFHKIAATLDELNKALKRRDFHGEVYSFRRLPARRFHDLIDLIERAQDPAFDLPLFQSPPRDDALGRAAALLEEIVSGTGDVREFEDPRNYYEFELYIYDQEGALKSSLAQRAATGSGGEYQIPLYVSMAAALAATYQDRKRGESGMALAVFDEAFNRLDVRNLQQCSGFLRDIGLQTVLAAPDEKHAVFMAEVDCLVNLIRSGEHVHLTIEWPRERTREALRQEDPRRKGLEGFRLLAGALAVPVPRQEDLAGLVRGAEAEGYRDRGG